MWRSALAGNRFQHESALIRQLGTPCVPFLVPGVLWAVVKELCCAKRSNADVVNTKVNFGVQQVALGCRVGSVDPTKLGPVPVA